MTTRFCLLNGLTGWNKVPDILLCGWKNHLELDLASRCLTPQSRLQFGEFAKRMFVDRVEHLPGEREKVQWGKGFGAGQAIPWCGAFP
jgi:hypothetical protein